MASIDELMYDKSLRPFVEIHGKEYPYGEFDKDGEFVVSFDAVSRYGWVAEPIWGVWLRDHKYKIFVGECPHKDESGSWVTYNKVPTFIISTFRGAYAMRYEKDIPHIIRLTTDEYNHKEELNVENDSKTAQAKIHELSQTICMCSFKTYIKGLRNRIKKRFGYITFAKRPKKWQLQYLRYPYSLTLYRDKENVYLCQETDDWRTFFYLKKDGKYRLKKDKMVNDHSYAGF